MSNGRFIKPSTNKLIRQKNISIQSADLYDKPSKNKLVRKDAADKDSNATQRYYIQQKKLHNNKIYRQQQQQEEEEEHYLPAICKFFSKTGKCDKGNTCSFLHDKQQVPECKFFSQGRCNVQSCPFKHVSSNNNNNNGALPASQSKDKKRARSPEQEEEEERQSKKAKPNADDDDGMSIVPQFFKSKMEML